MLALLTPNLTTILNSSFRQCIVMMDNVRNLRAEVIVLPVFAEVFSTTEDVVIQHIEELLSKTACDQSLQITLAEFRAEFPNGEKEVGGVSRAKGRPKWTAGGLVVPEPKTVEQLLVEVLVDSNKKLNPERHPKIEPFIDRFIQRQVQWGAMKFEDDEWRINWAGKELLMWLRKKMSAHFGWPSKEDKSVRVPVNWELLNVDQSGEWDRLIEHAMQKRLVMRFLNLLRTGANLPSMVIEEWHSIISDLRNRDFSQQ